MDPSLWYAVTFASLIGYILIQRFLNFIYVSFGTPLFRYIIYKQVTCWATDTLTFLDVFIILAFIAGNITSMVYGISNLQELRTRSGMMILINMIPLGFGRPNYITNKLRISSLKYSRAHGWFGVMVCVQTLTHLGASVSLSSTINKEIIAGYVVRITQWKKHN